MKRHPITFYTPNLNVLENKEVVYRFLKCVTHQLQNYKTIEYNTYKRLRGVGNRSSGFRSVIGVTHNRV